MIFRPKHLVSLLIYIFIGWIGLKTYHYFFDTTPPNIEFIGIEESNHYCGDVPCQIVTNKAGILSIHLDTHAIVKNFKVTNSEEHAFTIPTKTVINGDHALTIEVADTSYNKNRKTIKKNFTVDNSPLQAAFIKAGEDHKVFQGRTLHVQVQVNKKINTVSVQALSKTFTCVPEAPNSLIYECFIPIECEETPNEYLLSAHIEDLAGNKLNLESKLHIVAYPFKKHTLRVSAEKIAAEKEVGISSKEFEPLVEQLSKASPCKKLWKGTFCTPIDIAQVTCDFGAIRTTQEKGRYQHKAVDVINTPKCVVWAPQNGVVVLKERYDMTGNTVILDHGLGILSLFFHLDDFSSINVGDKVAQGGPIGTLGKTGYATGYHLHWEMRINNTQIDPLQWTKNNF